MTPSRLPRQELTLADKTRLCIPDPDWEIEGEVTDDYRRVELSRFHPGEQFVYVFDLGDDWASGMATSKG